MRGNKMRGTGKSAKPKPKSKPPPLEDAEQFQRFIETAEALEVDKSGKSFERALRAVIPSKKALGDPKTRRRNG